jgi:CheY-like chemotaxis protein
MTEDAKRPRRPEEVTVLVADDEPDVAEYLSSVLEDAGINVLTAHDGVEALEIIRRQPPDLISLDLVMPRKSGIRVLMELRKHREWSRIPVVIVTAHASDPEVRGDLETVLARSTMVGPSLYLEKPVTPHSYLQNICKVLNIELPAEPSDGDSEDALRERAIELLQSADTATLEAVLGTLKGEE